MMRVNTGKQKPSYESGQLINIMHGVSIGVFHYSNSEITKQNQ
jgi:hypothetical protein